MGTAVDLGCHTYYTMDNFTEENSQPHSEVVNLEEGNYMVQEIYEGVCGNHVRGQSLAYKAL